MKILKTIAITALACCYQSVFSMSEDKVRHVQYNRPLVRQSTQYNKWIQPGRDVITSQEYNQARQEAIAEGYGNYPHSHEEANMRGRALAADEDRMYTTPAMRQQREQRLRETLLQQHERENMRTEEGWE